MGRAALLGLVALWGACSESTSASWSADATAAVVGIDGSVVLTTAGGRCLHLDASGATLGTCSLAPGAEVVTASATDVLVWDPARGALDVVDAQGAVRWSASSAGATLVSAATDERGVVAVVTVTGSTQTLAVYEPDGAQRFAKTFAPDPRMVALVTASGEVRLGWQASVTLVFDASGATTATLPSGNIAHYDRDGGGLRLTIHVERSTEVQRVDAEGHGLWSKAFEKRVPAVALTSNGDGLVEVVAPEAAERSFLRIARYGMRLTTTPVGESAVIGGDATGLYTFAAGQLRRYED